MRRRPRFWKSYLYELWWSTGPSGIGEPQCMARFPWSWADRARAGERLDQGWILRPDRVLAALRELPDRSAAGCLVRALARPTVQLLDLPGPVKAETELLWEARCPLVGETIPWVAASPEKVSVRLPNGAKRRAVKEPRSGQFLVVPGAQDGVPESWDRVAPKRRRGAEPQELPFEREAGIRRAG